MGVAFSILARDGAARTGLLETAHGIVRTPAFMPVGTAGTVKGMMPEAVAAAGADMILGNTYHLMLRPGEETVGKLGGLHRFMNWTGPILTDSGGYQAMSPGDGPSGRTASSSVPISTAPATNSRRSARSESSTGSAAT